MIQMPHGLRNYSHQELKMEFKTYYYIIGTLFLLILIYLFRYYYDYHEFVPDNKDNRKKVIDILIRGDKK